MLALDNGDAIRGTGSVASKLDFTIHGLVGTVATQLADGQAANSETDMYLAGTAGIVVTAITVVNTDTSARTIDIYLKPSGGTSRRIIPKALSLAAGYSLVFDGQKIQVLDTSGQIQYSISRALGDLSNVTLAGEADHDMLYYDNATSLWKNTTPATILAQLSGQAGIAFDWGGQNLTNLGSIAAFTLAGKLTAGAVEIESSAFDINGGTIAAVTLDGTITLNGQDLDAGSGNLQVKTSGNYGGILITSTATGAYGVRIRRYMNSSSPAVNDSVSLDWYTGKNDAGQDVEYHHRYTWIDNVGDGSEGCRLQWDLMNGGAIHTAMKLSAAGQVSGDLAYAEFDKWDDKAVVLQKDVPEELRKIGIAEQFVKMGIVDRKDNGEGYMLNLQQSFWFNFHALKVAFREIDSLRERVSLLELNKGGV